MNLKESEEIVWSRVLLALIAVTIFVVTALIAVSWVASALTAKAPAVIEHSSVEVIEVVPAPATNITQAWPEDVLQLRPAYAGDLADLPGLMPAPDLVPLIQEEEPGVRDMGEHFTIRRTNVSGNKDLTIRITAYGWRQFPQIKWYSDGLGKYLDQYAPKGEKYVFVFLASYVDGTTPGEDPRPWYFGPHLFRLQVDGRLYDQDTDFVPAVRIKDLEEIENYNGIRGLDPYGYTVINNRGNITALSDTYVKMGKSNAKDGYLVYRVPWDARPEDMILVGSFGSWGSAGWRLIQ